MADIIPGLGVQHSLPLLLSLVKLHFMAIPDYCLVLFPFFMRFQFDIALVRFQFYVIGCLLVLNNSFTAIHIISLTKSLHSFIILFVWVTGYWLLQSGIELQGHDPCLRSVYLDTRPASHAPSHYRSNAACPIRSCVSLMQKLRCSRHRTHTCVTRG